MLRRKEAAQQRLRAYDLRGYKGREGPHQELEGYHDMKSATKFMSLQFYYYLSLEAYPLLSGIIFFIGQIFIIIFLVSLFFIIFLFN